MSYMTIQDNLPKFIVVIEITSDYIIYKSGSMYISDNNFVENQKQRKAKLYSTKGGKYYFIDAETQKRQSIENMITHW